MAKTLAEMRMRKKTGFFDDKIKKSVQSMAKDSKYRGSNSKFEADVRKKHGDKNADHFVIQNIIRKHAEMHEAKKIVLKKGDPRIKAIQTVQAKKKKAFDDLAKNLDKTSIRTIYK